MRSRPSIQMTIYPSNSTLLFFVYKNSKSELSRPRIAGLFLCAPGMARGAQAPYVQLWWLNVDLEVQVESAGKSRQRGGSASLPQGNG